MKKNTPASPGKPEIAETAPVVTAVKPIRPPKKTEISLRVEFTRDEIVELALKQGEAFNELNRAEEDKKAVTAQLKARCEGIGARISEITGKLTSGFEYRTVPCEIRYDEPKPGLKTTVRLDTNADVNVEPMTLAERQAELDLDKKAAPAPAPAVQLTVELFDLTDAQVFVGEEDEETQQKFSGWLRELFVDKNDEDEDAICGEDTRRATAIAIVIEEGEADAEAFLKWLREPREAANALPAADLAVTLIEHALREFRAKAKHTKAAGRANSPRVNAGTVEVDADEGSRDDAGSESKTNL